MSPYLVPWSEHVGVDWVRTGGAHTVFCVTPRDSLVVGAGRWIQAAAPGDVDDDDDNDDDDDGDNDDMKSDHKQGGNTTSSRRNSSSESKHGVGGGSSKEEYGTGTGGGVESSLCVLPPVDVLVSWCRHKRTDALGPLLRNCRQRRRGGGGGDGEEVGGGAGDAVGAGADADDQGSSSMLLSGLLSAHDDNSNNLLLVACQNGHLDIVKLLVDAAMDSNFGIGGVASCSSKSATFAAADFINHQNSKGNSALHYCMAYGFLEIKKYLIEHGHADEFLLNHEGLTCYEGLSRSDLDKL